MIITTAIDYPNALPHIGTAYEKVLADIQCRGMRLGGGNAQLLMGVDENTAKVEKRAADLRMNTQEYADLMADQFLHCWNALEIKHDYFVRTSSQEHRKLVEDFIAKVRTNSPGAIYWGEYESLYCDGCEEHKTASKLEDNVCPAHPNLKLRLFKEPCWMFRLTQFQQEVSNLLTGKSLFTLKVSPEGRKNEALSLLQSTHDMCISREMTQVSKLTPHYSSWGIPFPVDSTTPKSWIAEHQRIYVWFDALLSYLHAGSTPAIHHIGKDINRFHTNLWPAMLLAAKQPLPVQIMIHGFILCNGDKASKTTGGNENINDLIGKYGTDAIRYYYASVCKPDNDNEFTEEILKTAYNSDLVNKLGNLASRISNLILKHFPDGLKVRKYLSRIGGDWIICPPAIPSLYMNGKHAEACDHVRKLCNTENERLEREKPWVAISEGRMEEAEETLSQVFIGLRQAAFALSPVIPSLETKFKENFGMEFHEFPPEIKVHKFFPWFPRMK